MLGSAGRPGRTPGPGTARSPRIAGPDAAGPIWKCGVDTDPASLSPRAAPAAGEPAAGAAGGYPYTKYFIVQLISLRVNAL